MSFLPAESTKGMYMFRAGNQADFWARLAMVIVVVFPRLLGAVFILAGATKLLRPAALMGVLQYDGIPKWLVGPVGYTVITLELWLGLLLIVMPGRLWVIRASLVLLIVYTAQLGYLLLFADAPPCGCIELLEAVERRERYRWHNFLSLVRNFCLLLPMWWVWLQLDRPATSGSPNQIPDPHDGNRRPQ